MTLIKNLPLILLADPDPASLTILAKTLNRQDMSFSTADNGDETMTMIRESRPRIVICDMNLPGLPIKDLLRTCTRDYPETKIIVVSDDSNPETIVDCMQLGAVDYLSKPFELQRVVNTVLNILKLQELESAQRSLAGAGTRSEISPAFDKFIGNSYLTACLLKRAEIFAHRKFPVFINGETGTGKRLLARLIHAESGDSRSFVLINALGISDADFIKMVTDVSLAQETGTIYINDIDQLSMDVQIYLAQWLRDQKYSYPFNAVFPQKVNIQPKYSIRWLFGAAQKLEPLMRQKLFREDLYFLLTSNTIHMPPLRDNTDDIPALLDYFLALSAHRMNKPIPTYPKELVSLLKSYHFPGNAGELGMMVETAMAFHENRMLSTSRFAQLIEERRENTLVSSRDPATYQEMIQKIQQLPSLKQAKRLLIREALRRSDGNQSAAAKQLGITRQAINIQLKNMDDGGDNEQSE